MIGHIWKGKRQFEFIIFLLFTTLSCVGQKNITYTNQQWFQYFNQFRLSNNWGVNSDFSLRRTDSFKDWSQITLRSGISYQIAENLQGLTGIACFTFFSDNSMRRIELRPYQELSTSQLFGNVSVHHRLRAEARYFRDVNQGTIMSTSDFNFRFRYRLFLAIPILKFSTINEDCKLLLNIGNELFINAGTEIIYNALDNNRFMMGSTFQANKKVSIFFSYTKQIGQRSLPKTYENTDILILGIIHRIDLRVPAILIN